MKMFLIGLTLAFFSYANGPDLTAEPDLRTLQSVGRIIHSQQSSIPTDKGWEDMTQLMKKLTVFDLQVERIMKILCSSPVNKSVLLVGEPDSTFKYYAARLAMMQPSAGCKRLSHVEIMPGKLQGYMYVGTSERLWEEKIERTSYNKDVLLLFSNLTQLIGIGTHMNQDTGMEQNYSEAISSGKLKSVAYMNKYDYERLVSSRHAYVLSSFQETIKVDDVSLEQVDQLVRGYFQFLAPNTKIDETILKYLYRMAQYYRPNVREPQRTVGLVEYIVRAKNGTSSAEEKVVNISTPSPLPSNHTQVDMVEFPGAKSMALVFDYFRTGYGQTKMEIFNARTNELLDTLSTTQEGFTTKYYLADKLKLSFVARGYGSQGFKVSKALAQLNQASDEGKVTHDDVRTAVMIVAQIPEWVVKRDYKVIKELQAKLDDDLVGVQEGKMDVINQVKIGYVSGRTDEKSAGNLMFVGPTGTGKSYLVKKTAEFMNMRLITFDMTQYTTEESFDRFLDTMSNQLRLYPYSIFLMEEIDKANIRILDRLYFMLDEGIFYDRNQVPLFARGAFIMMTTNTADTMIVNNRHNPNLRAMVDEELNRVFRPSFLNRFDAIPIFLPFTDEEYYQLAKVMNSKKIFLMKEFYDWDVEVDDKVVRYMGATGHSIRYGARPMERTVERVISIGVSNFQLEYGNVEFGSKMQFFKEAGEHDFKIIVDGKEMLYQVPPTNNSGLTDFFDPFALAYIFQHY